MARNNPVIYQFLFGSKNKLNNEKSFIFIYFNRRIVITISDSFLKIEIPYVIKISDIKKSIIVKESIRRGIMLAIISNNKDFSKNICKISHKENGKRFSDVNDLLMSSNFLKNNSFKEIVKKENVLLFISSYIHNKDAKNEYLMSSVCAFIKSFHSQNAYDEFSYLWIAMNGLYNYDYDGCKRFEANKISRFEEKQFLNNTDNFKSCLNDTNVFGNLLIKLASFEKNILDIKDKDSIICNSITLLFNGVVKLSFEHEWCYSFVLLRVCYKVRCNFFHSNLHIPLISFANDIENRALNALNTLLSDYLCCNIYKFFNRIGG